MNNSVGNSCIRGRGRNDSLGRMIKYSPVASKNFTSLHIKFLTSIFMIKRRFITKVTRVSDTHRSYEDRVCSKAIYCWMRHSN